eukprot:COSAG01_NODE_4483_length_4984_cov_1.930194_1_plen_208_part_10
MAAITVFSPEKIDPQLFRMALDDDGQPLRDFEAGGYVKVNETTFSGSEDTDLIDYDGELDLDSLLGLQPKSRLSPEAIAADAEPSAVFEVLKVGLPDQCHASAAQAIMPGSRPWDPQQTLLPEDSGPGDFVLVKAISSDEELLPFKADTFVSDMQDVARKAWEEQPGSADPDDEFGPGPVQKLRSSELLAKCGIYHKNHLLVGVSNRA